MTDQSRTPICDKEWQWATWNGDDFKAVPLDVAIPLELEAADLRERLAKVAANIAGSPANVVEWSEMVGRVLIEMDIEMDRLSERLAKAEALAKQRNSVSELLMDKLTELLDIVMSAHDAHSFWTKIRALKQKGADHE